MVDQTLPQIECLRTMRMENEKLLQERRMAADALARALAEAAGREKQAEDAAQNTHDTLVHTHETQMQALEHTVSELQVSVCVDSQAAHEAAEKARLLLQDNASLQSKVHAACTCDMTLLLRFGQLHSHVT